jgi:hypothetical protein
MKNRMKIARTLRALFTLATIALCASSVRAQVAVAPLQLVRQQFLSSTGVPLASACIDFFATGTSNRQAIYADSGGVNQLPNPLTLDAAGEASVWMTNTGYDIQANTGVNNTLCSVSEGSQLWKEINKNPFSIINGGSNYIVASGTSDPAGTAGEFAFRSDLPCLRFFISTWDCVMEVTLAQSPTNKTIDISANTLKNSTNTAGHYPRNNGTQYVDSTISASDISTSFANASVTGTVLNEPAKLTGAPSTAVVVGITDTAGIIGIVISGAGTTGSALIQTSGIANCVFDSPVTAGDYVQVSTTVSGNCHDIGIAPPAYPVNVSPQNAQILGRVLASGVAGTYPMQLFPPEDKGISSVTAVTAVNLTAQAANIGTTNIVTPTANGFYRIGCYLVVTQAATTSSTLPSCVLFYTDADTSIGGSATLTSTSTANTVGTSSATNGAAPNPVSATTVGSAVFFAKTGVAISYGTSNYSSVGGTPMQYALHLRLEGPF